MGLTRMCKIGLRTENLAGVSLWSESAADGVKARRLYGIENILPKRRIVRTFGRISYLSVKITEVSV